MSSNSNTHTNFLSFYSKTKFHSCYINYINPRLCIYVVMVYVNHSNPLSWSLYAVVKKTDKHFTHSINGHNDTVSIDHLKPAHLDTNNVFSPGHQTQSHSTPCTQNQPPHNTFPATTHSGRHVHFPNYLFHNV